MAAFEELNVADKKKEMIAMPRHSFIQMTKLHNVMGRIDYITSTVKQENLYAIYATQPLRSFWKDLAKCNREEFAKSGTIGKYIEARELIIALPEGLYHYEHDYLIKHFATDFKKKYGVDCYAALHHNKRKTNFHIHLIFAERTKLEKPVVKVASRNMFYDESGKHVRTKKEILDASGDIRNGCKIIRKGEVYEKKEFSIKDDRFKQDSFLDEAKVLFTNEINQLVLREEDKLKVFDKNRPYLATKKIGKNNPMEEQIKADNEVRQEWNRTVDRAIVSGVSEEDISKIRKDEITKKIRDSIDLYGDRPDLLASIIKLAISVLELLINRIMLAMVGAAEKIVDTVVIDKWKSSDNVKLLKPKMSFPVAKFQRLTDIDIELQKINNTIFEYQQQRSNLKIELLDCKGMLKSGKYAELKKQIDILDIKIKLETQAKNEFSEANRAYLIEKEKLEELFKKRAVYEAALKEQLSGSLNISEINICKKNINSLKSAIRTQLMNVKKAEDMLEVKRVALNELMKERKTHEKLRDKKFEDFQKEEKDNESKEIDQLVSFTYNS